MGEYVNAAAIFGENVFNDKVMQERLQIGRESCRETV